MNEQGQNFFPATERDKETSIPATQFNWQGKEISIPTKLNWRGLDDKDKTIDKNIPFYQREKIFSKYGPTLAQDVSYVYFSSNSMLKLLEKDAYGDEMFDSSGLLYDALLNKEEYNNLPSDIKTQFIKDLIMFLSDSIQYETDQMKLETVPDDSFHNKPRSTFLNRKDVSYNKDNYDDFTFENDSEEYEESNRNYEPECYEIMIKILIGELETTQFDPINKVDFLIDFWQKNQDPYYGPIIADSASRINIERASQRLIEDISKNDKKDKRQNLSLLYRLELGKIGISEEGVAYLGRKFDLGEYNNIDNFVQRLTADGKVGIFDQQKALLGFFQLQGSDFINSQDNEVSEAIKKVLDSITIDMLFVPRPDETAQDRTEKETLLLDFKNNYFSTYLELFKEQEQKIGLHFNDLALPEQGFALSFLNKHREDSLMPKFFDFLSKYGEEGFRAFRSIEFDPDAGEKILTLDQDISPQETKDLFKQYGETYKTAEALALWIKQVLQVDMKNPSTRDSLEANVIREQILRRAQDALVNPKMNIDGKIEISPVQYSLGGTSGEERLIFMNSELKKIAALPPTIDNFEQVQFILNRYLIDEVPSGDKLAVSEQVISDGLARLYNNNEFSLRDYEGKTTDTAKSLEALLNSIDKMIPQEMTNDPENKLIYDIGAGDGRIAIPLALSGYRVVGIDNSERMVADSKTRPQEFIESYKTGRDDHLVNSIQDAFLSTDQKIDDEDIESLDQKIDIRHGNFFNFGPEDFKQQFGDRQPDAVIIMWHTLGFAGNVDKMKQVLTNAFNILRPGGKIFIEMPDRNFGGYARAIRDFHDSNPTIPFGAIKDAPSKNSDNPSEQDEDRATWRYFPKNSEINNALSDAGFDISFALLKSYFVQAEANPTAKLLIKENMFVAQKPLDKTRQDILMAYAQKNFSKQKNVPNNLDQARRLVEDA